VDGLFWPTVEGNALSGPPAPWRAETGTASWTPSDQLTPSPGQSILYLLMAGLVPLPSARQHLH
jgi:hypothetical protein